MTIGQRIKGLRKPISLAGKKLTQARLAEALGVSLRTVTGWETDEVVPSGPNLTQLAAALGTTPDYILHGTEAGRGSASGPVVAGPSTRMASTEVMDRAGDALARPSARLRVLESEARREPWTPAEVAHGFRYAAKWATELEEAISTLEGQIETGQPPDPRTMATVEFVLVLDGIRGIPGLEQEPEGAWIVLAEEVARQMAVPHEARRPLFSALRAGRTVPEISTERVQELLRGSAEMTDELLGRFRRREPPRAAGDEQV